MSVAIVVMNLQLMSFTMTMGEKCGCVTNVGMNEWRRRLFEYDGEANRK